MEIYESIRELTESGYALTIKALNEKMADGRYELDGGAYAFISSYETKPLEEGLYEAHKEYTDVQVILEGKEIIGVMSLDEMRAGECKKEYEYDVELYKTKGGKLLEIVKGGYVILTPSEAHMPGVSREPSRNRKLVIKVPYKAKKEY